MPKQRLGLAICGSFCTFSQMLEAIKPLGDTYHITPILSEATVETDTRFWQAKAFRQEIEALTGNAAITTISTAEPIGPQALLDVIVVAPCTGNTLAKLAGGVTDSTVTMACKAHLRNGRPVILGISTNDGLSGNGANIGALLNRKHYYFLPFTQDNPQKKPNSLVADFTRIGETVAAALEGRQLQPILC